MPKSRQIAAPVAMLASLGLSLGVVEVGLRLLNARSGKYTLTEQAERARTESIWQISQDPELLYVHRAHYRKQGVLYTEANGLLRPRDVPVERSGDGLRIALVGDSISAALYMDYGLRFGSVLERRLRRIGPSEVLNFGVNGYGTTQHARVVETRVSRFRPDLILLQYCMNDPGTSITPTSWFLRAESPVSHLLAFVRERLPERFGGGDPRLRNVVPSWGPGFGTSGYWFSLYEPGSSTWQAVLRGFDRIAAYAATRGIPVAIVVFPFLMDPGGDVEQARSLHAQVQAAAEQRGWASVDLLPVLGAIPADELRIDPKDIYHPNARGHRLAAEHIHARLAEEELLPAAPASAEGGA